MTPVRVLGACGLVSACLSAVGGFSDTPALVGVSGAVMVFGNIFALIKGRKGSS